MRSLTLNDIAYSLSIRVYCLDCGIWFDPRTEKLKNRKKKCSHPPNKQRYKSTVIVPKNGGKRKRKSIIHNTRNLQEAIHLGLEFKKHVKENGTKKTKKNPAKPTLLIDCLAMFLDYKNGVGVPEHLKKNLSTGALAEFKNHIIKWKNASETIEEDFCKLKVDEISMTNVSALLKYIRKYSNSTQKKAIGFYNSFFSFLQKKGYKIESPFKGIQVSTNSSENEPRAVNYEEFNKICNAIKKGTKSDKNKAGRIIYFDWLNEALSFAAYTGRRREEFMLAKFSDINLINGQLVGGYIKMVDIKYTRQNSHKIGFKAKYTKAPIFPELADFLNEMGYENYKNLDRFIIAGDETKQRNTLANNLTNAFAFYRNKLNMDKRIQLKGLRKNYITRMRNEFGDNANFFTGHSSSRIDKIHYYDDRGLFKKIENFKLWKR